MKITTELIQGSPQFINPVGDREIQLRGLKIAVIENLGAAEDQFDTLDLSDNEIRLVGGFPPMPRLKNLVLNNNRVSRLSDTIASALPNLTSIIVTNNRIRDFESVSVVQKLKYLETVSFLNNELCRHPHYRLLLIHWVPSLRFIDFRRIRDEERKNAKKLFAGEKGQSLLKEVTDKSKAIVAAQLGEDISTGPSQQQVEAIKQAIAEAKTLEQVEKLERALKTGEGVEEALGQSPKPMDI